MTWIKTVLLDIIVTLLILLAVFTEIPVLDTIVVVYTPIMLALKLLEVFGAGLVNTLRSAAAEPPAWFVYLLYAINVVLLCVAGWWWTAGQWVLIAILSLISRQRQK